MTELFAIWYAAFMFLTAIVGILLMMVVAFALVFFVVGFIVDWLAD